MAGPKLLAGFMEAPVIGLPTVIKVKNRCYTLAILSFSQLKYDKKRMEAI